MSDYNTRRTMMVDTQVRPSDVTKYPIIAAMLAVPREAFVPENRREAAYVGENLDVGGRVMLEARSLAKLLDALDVQPDEAALDIGCGLGYSTAILARLAASVLGIESDAALAAQAQATLASQGVANAAVQLGALAAGAEKSAPFGAILVQGGVELVPDALLAQLAEGGRIGAIFMNGALGVARIGHKSAGKVTWRSVFNAAAPVLPGFALASGFVL